MSVVHHGMPLIATLSPDRICARRLVKVAGMSPDHRAAPYRWLPAHAERTRLTVPGRASRAIPSANVRAFSRGYMFPTSSPGPAW